MRLTLAQALTGTGEHEDAIEQAQRAADFARHREQHGHWADALAVWGEALAQAGRGAEAIERLEATLAQARACEMDRLLRRLPARIAQLQVLHRAAPCGPR